MSTKLFTDLISAGIPLQEATVLDGNFSTEQDFTEGLESISTWLALKTIPPTQPTGQPWRDIFNVMKQETAAGLDLDSAYSNSLHPYPFDIQVSLTKAVGVRLKAVLDFEQQKGSKKVFKTKDYLTQLKNLGYTFRLNELDDTIEVNGKPLTDGIAAEIRGRMNDSGFSASGRVEDAYIAYAESHRYHPVKAYLSSLTWDGKSYIEELAGYFSDKENIFGLWLRKWLIGACAKVFEAEQNPMLVLDGKQRIGKSEFVKWLGRPLEPYTAEGMIRPDDKDSLVRLAKFWIWEVSELGSTTRKADYESLKAFLTTRHITVRKAYARFDINKPALCSFVGTINNSGGIFSDPTGSSRFLVTTILSIDWNYSKLDPAGVWAEAMASYLAGEPWKLTADEAARAAAVNETYDISDPIIDLLEKYFEIKPGNKKLWTATIDILAVLEDPYFGRLKGNTKGNSMALGAALTKLGLEPARGYGHNGQRVRGYWGIQALTTPPVPPTPPMPPGAQYPLP